MLYTRRRDYSSATDLTVIRIAVCEHNKYNFY